MSQENVDLVRRAYESLERGLEATWDIIDEIADPDFEIRATGHLPDVGRVRGREAAKAYFAGIFETFDWSAEAEEFIDAGDVVIVPAVQIGRGKGSGAELRTRIVHVWGVRAGKVTYFDGYRTKKEALEAVRLSE
jgi:ketosteroid isomerase-like protein